MRYVFELTPAAILFTLAAALMVPYLGFLVGIVLVASILATVAAAALGAAIAVPWLLVLTVRRVRIRLTGRGAGRHARAIETELTRLGAR
jgi:hypothetical protein